MLSNALEKRRGECVDIGRIGLGGVQGLQVVEVLSQAPLFGAELGDDFLVGDRPKPFGNQLQHDLVDADGSSQAQRGVDGGSLEPAGFGEERRMGAGHPG